jgi:hypothetical protein
MNNPFRFLVRSNGKIRDKSSDIAHGQFNFNPEFPVLFSEFTPHKVSD